MTSAARSAHPPVRVQSVERAVRLLLAIATGDCGRTVTSLATRIGVAVPTAHHLLNTLVSLDLLSHDRQSVYTLGPQVGLLAEAYRDELSIPPRMLGRVESLARDTGETAFAAGWDRSGGISVLSAVSGRRTDTVAPPDTRFPDAGRRPGGIALLAFAPTCRLASFRPAAGNAQDAQTPYTQWDAELQRMRHRGFAVDVERYRQGVCEVSAPVLMNGNAVVSFSLAVPTVRFQCDAEPLVAAVRAAARRAESELTGAVGETAAG